MPNDLYDPNNQTPAPEGETQAQRAAKQRYFDLNDRIYGSESYSRGQQDYYRQQGEAAQNRGAPGMDFSRAHEDYARQQGIGGLQDELGQYYRNMMEGKGPSVAERQFQSNLDASIRAQSAMGASGRGGIGSAQAMRSAAEQANSMQMQSYNQAAMLRASEQQAAAQGYGALLQQQRAAELQALGYSQAEAMAIADNEARQRAANDALTGLYTGAEGQASGAYMDALMQQQGMRAGNYNAGIGAGASRYASDRDWSARMYGAAAQTAGAVLGTI